MKLVNLTGENLNFCQGNNVILTIPSSGGVLNPRTTEEPEYMEMGGLIMPVGKIWFPQVESLPDPEVGVGIVVPEHVGPACSTLGRNDIYVPFRPVLDKDGRSIGYRGLNQVGQLSLEIEWGIRWTEGLEAFWEPEGEPEDLEDLGFLLSERLRRRRRKQEAAGLYANAILAARPTLRRMHGDEPVSGALGFIPN